MTLRIVHLGKYYPPARGGIETHTQTLVRHQAKLGCDVRVVVVNHADKAGRDVTFEGRCRTPDRVECDGPVRVYRVGRVANLAKLDVTPGLPTILRKLLKDPPDVWHLHAPNITMMLALAGNPAIRPLVITHHSDIVRQRLLKHLVRPLERLICNRAARILTDSPPYAGGSRLLAKYSSKVVALPLGIELQPFVNPSAAALVHAEQLRAVSAGPIWVSTGRLVYYKALDVALHALKKLPGTLHIIGTGPMEPVWRSLAASLGVADRVVWRGRVSDDELVGTYRAATALWFPSNERSEGFGLVQVEAMACGCPVVNANIPHSGVPWVSRNEETGLTVPVNDPVAFAAASRRIHTEPGLRERLSNEALLQAKLRFDAVQMAARSLEIYRESIAR